MDIKKFNLIIEEWLKQFNNVNLSGVAKVSDGAKTFWSASIGVIGDGSFPSVKIENLDVMRHLIEQHPLNIDFRFPKVYVVQFIMEPDIEQKRWQVQWLFQI